MAGQEQFCRHSSSGLRRTGRARSFPSMKSVLCALIALLSFHLVAAADKPRNYMVSFPDGRVTHFTPGERMPKTKPDSLKDSKFIITFTDGKSAATVKGVGGGNESYKAPLIRIGNDKNILNFIETYPTSVMIWTIWLSNSVDKDNPKIKRATLSTHKSSIIGERVGTYWGTAVDMDKVLDR